MIKAIVLDCFGVLVTEAWLPFKAEYFGKDKAKYQAATDLTVRANRGLISHEDFLAGAAELAGISYEAAAAYISRNVPNEPLFEYLRELKPHYKLGFLSNVAADYLSRMFTPEHLALFDVIALSYKTGHVKPEIGAYTDVAERLGVKPQEALMVDDQERNTTGAVEAGMHAILYKNVDKLKAELGPLLA
jgi:putative hydrolase of the HAD superfamily